MQDVSVYKKGYMLFLLSVSNCNYQYM